MNMTPIVLNLSKMKGRNNPFMILMLVQFGLLISAMFLPKAMLAEIAKAISIFDKLSNQTVQTAIHDEELDDTFQRR